MSFLPDFIQETIKRHREASNELARELATINHGLANLSLTPLEREKLVTRIYQPRISRMRYHGNRLAKLHQQ